jgi:hypothetical protein
MTVYCRYVKTNAEVANPFRDSSALVTVQSSEQGNVERIMKASSDATDPYASLFVDVSTKLASTKDASKISTW